MSEIDHYQALFDKNYMRWFHLQDKPSLVKITKVIRSVEMTLPGGRKTKKPCIEFTQVQGSIQEVKPLVLNSTNAQAIAKIHGDKPSQWAGKEIVLYPTTCEMFDKDQRKMVQQDCIRVREKKEKAAK